jgi:5'-3' exoribonuclease 2
MNQQRSRRFRSAKEAKEKDEDKESFRKLLLASQRAKGEPETEEPAEPEKTWDSNVITPGTPFMHMLSESLKYWVAYKLNTDPLWRNLKVIISDASVPGEGEHKIMEFVRSQRRSPAHDPNTRHVIYGLDADLIMLALATHEPHFRVIREDVFFQSTKPNACRLCGQVGHKAAECRGDAKIKDGEFDEKQKEAALKPFIWLKVNVLREYLEQELQVPNQGFKFDLERALDDWVFLCFFVGNDFLPHLPSLSIREEGISSLLQCWRENLPLMGGYVTKDGHVNLERCQAILGGLAKQEDEIFKRRKQIDDKREAGAKRRKLQEEAGGNSGRGTPTNRGRGGRRGPQENHSDVQLFAPGEARTEVRKLTHEMMVNKKANFQAEIAADPTAANKSAAAALRERMKKGNLSQAAADEGDGDATADGDIDMQTTPGTLKRKASMLDEDNGTPGRSTPLSTTDTPQTEPNELPPDDVRLWEDGYADRYYELKFHVPASDIAFRRKVAADYVEGVSWVLLYYMQGCPSWTWYYPHHYAPFAADFAEIANQKVEFDRGQPFRPYEQLMGVFPAASRHAIPDTFHALMTDEDSPIIDFYPEDFPIDLNGKKFAWQGVALLPFIDEKRLLDAMNERYHLLSEDEKARNTVGHDYLLFSGQHPMYDDLVMNWYSKKAGEAEMKLNPLKSDKLSGKVFKNEEFLPQSTLVYPLSNGGMPDLDIDNSMRYVSMSYLSTLSFLLTSYSVIYEMPTSTHIHKSMLLHGLIMPPKELNQGDIEQARRGSSRGGRGSFGGSPYRGDRNGGNGNGNGRGGGGGGGRGSYSAPFAGHSNFDPRIVPPPHIAAQLAAQGYPPPPGFGPPPPGFGGPPPPPGMGYNSGGYNSSNSYNNSSSYNNNSYSNGQSNYQSQGQGYNRDGYSGGGGGRRDDQYSNGHGGGRGGRGGRGGGRGGAGRDYNRY